LILSHEGRGNLMKILSAKGKRNKGKSLDIACPSGYRTIVLLSRGFWLPAAVPAGRKDIKIVDMIDERR
jgi:hypothetical protein